VKQAVHSFEKMPLVNKQYQFVIGTDLIDKLFLTYVPVEFYRKTESNNETKQNSTSVVLVLQVVDELIANISGQDLTTKTKLLD